jgi:hypothetical protein
LRFNSRHSPIECYETSIVVSRLRYKAHQRQIHQAQESGLSHLKSNWSFTFIVGEAQGAGGRIVFSGVSASRFNHLESAASRKDGRDVVLTAALESHLHKVVRSAARRHDLFLQRHFVNKIGQSVGAQ